MSDFRDRQDFRGYAEMVLDMWRKAAQVPKKRWDILDAVAKDKPLDVITTTFWLGVLCDPGDDDAHVLISELRHSVRRRIEKTLLP